MIVDNAGNPRQGIRFGIGHDADAMRGSGLGDVAPESTGGDLIEQDDRGRPAFEQGYQSLAVEIVGMAAQDLAVKGTHGSLGIAT